MKPRHLQKYMSDLSSVSEELSCKLRALRDQNPHDKTVPDILNVLYAWAIESKWYHFVFSFCFIFMPRHISLISLKTLWQHLQDLYNVHLSRYISFGKQTFKTNISMKCTYFCIFSFQKNMWKKNNTTLLPHVSHVMKPTTRICRMSTYIIECFHTKNVHYSTNNQSVKQNWDHA